METLSLFMGADDPAIVRPDDCLLPDAETIARAPGLRYHPEFITPAEEAALLAVADSQVWSNHWQRKTQYYGRRYAPPEAGVVDDRRAPLPEWSLPYAERLVERGLFGRPPNQLGVNEYLPGQGIAPHIDHGAGAVASLTLGSGCVMDLTEVDGPGAVSVWLAPRSILVIDGAVRERWMHGIARRRKDFYAGRVLVRGRRVALLFRDIPDAPAEPDGPLVP